ncbi:hypothetical protein BFX40_18680 [Mesorhizobium sp. SEMIA 3007]|nr:hypothetical protein BFX40_18680 [Mesorhizobium sp. SEMIA 3007]
MTTGRWDGRRSPNHEMDQKHPLEASAIPSGEVRLPAASGRAAIIAAAAGFCLLEFERTADRWKDW